MSLDAAWRNLYHDVGALQADVLRLQQAVYRTDALVHAVATDEEWREQCAVLTKELSVLSALQKQVEDATNAAHRNVLAARPQQPQPHLHAHDYFDE
jgi:hypothetical protein